MPDQEPAPAAADEIPRSGRMIEYDDRYRETYIRFLEADNEGLSKDDVDAGEEARLFGGFAARGVVVG